MNMSDTMYSHHHTDFEAIDGDYGYLSSSPPSTFSLEHFGQHQSHQSESPPRISTLTTTHTGLLSRTLFSHIPHIPHITLRHSHQQQSRSSSTSPHNFSSDGYSSVDMSRPSSSHRPTHIPLPPPTYPRTPNGGSPSGTPAPLASPTSPRSSFLPSFIRNRSRAATITGRNSPRTEQPDPLAATRTISNAAAANGGVQGGGTGGGRDGGGVTRSVSTPNTGGLANGSNQASSVPTGPPIDPKGKTHRIRLVPHLENTRSLAFDPVIRELYPIAVREGISPQAAAASITTLGPLVNDRPPALLLKVGRFTEKTPAAGAAAGSNANGEGGSERPATGISGPTITIAGGGGEITNGKIAFKSKVVSRSHAEIWCEAGGKFYIKDTASSSGTFLNHIRLSSPNTESRPTQLNDGDVLQLGVDYQGGTEEMFRCVKIRVELGREWQRAANEFNTNALKQLKALGGAVPATPEGKGKASEITPGKKKASVTDCCICLFSVTVCQSLFIAPCSHVFHYKCIRPLLTQHHPGFSCPLCRTFANLEEDVETEDAWEIASRRASVISRKPSNHSIRLPRDSDSVQQPGSDAPDGPPSSGIGFGPGAASVDEILAGNSSTSEEGGLTEEDIDIGSRAVIRPDAEMGSEPPAETSANDLESPNEVQDPLAGNTLVRPRPPMALPLPDINIESSRRSSYDPQPTASILDAQTPMNDYFLSTLATTTNPTVGLGVGVNMPSVHEQLERAELEPPTLGGVSIRDGTTSEDTSTPQAIPAAAQETRSVS